MRHLPTLLVFACLAACSPSSPKDTAATQGPASAEMSESSQSSMAIVAVSDVAASSSDGTCLSEIGKAASDRLVARCIMVSPATHPPCNATNSCQMIQGEIDRSCAMYSPEDKKPAECSA